MVANTLISNTLISNTLEKWMTLRNLSMTEIQENFAVSESHIQSASYQKLSDLVSFRNTVTQPGIFFFRDGRFAMLYVSGSTPEVKQLTLQILKDYLGEPNAVLRSRAGRHNRLHVHPSKGIAFSTGYDNTVDFVEIFLPISLEEYQTQIYEEPSKFIR